MKHIYVLLVLLSVSAYAQQVVLQPWIEHYGAVNGEQLGKNVTGLTPSTDFPYKAAVSKIDNTGVYLLLTQSDTTIRQRFMGENLLTGNLNNDGNTDVVITKSVNGWDTVLVYWGTAAGIDTLSPVKIPGDAQNDRLHAACIADLNNDGYLDLINIEPNYGIDQGKVTIHLGPNIMSTPSAAIIGDSVRSGLGGAACVCDLNSDGHNDLILRGWNQAGPSDTRYDYVNVYWGVGVDTLNLTLGIQMKTRSIVVPGLACFDANGDGKDDLLWTTRDSVGYWVNVHFGRIAFDTIPDIRLRNPPGIASIGDVVANGGDLNGDGFNDVLVSAPDATTVNGYVFVYCGGPLMDGNFDAYVGRNYDSRFGASVSSVGDINGDGLSDFIVGAPRYPFFPPVEFDKGYWGIFKGDSTIRVTNVREGLNKPEAFTLRQAYPNPFNPTTTIGFDLQIQAQITIEVSDQLGRHVKTLVDHMHSPGHHSVEFNAFGLSSGVYYYRMTVQQNGTMVFQQTKHFTLLK